jgi:hypothetical protein
MGYKGGGKVINDEARQYFKDKGLTYDVLNTYTVDLLVNFLQGEILKMRKEQNDCILLRINNQRYTKKQRELNDFNNLEITVEGTYFKKREAISFNTGGFIGFAGWACTNNTKPFIDGFIKWCDELTTHQPSSKNKEES